MIKQSVGYTVQREILVGLSTRIRGFWSLGD